MISIITKIFQYYSFITGAMELNFPVSSLEGLVKSLNENVSWNGRIVPSDIIAIFMARAMNYRHVTVP